MDGKSILDSYSSSKPIFRDTEEDPESYVGSSANSNTSQHSTNVRIKIRKNSQDPQNKIRANIQKNLQNQGLQQQIHGQHSLQNFNQTQQSMTTDQRLEKTAHVRIKSPEAKKSNNSLQQTMQNVESPKKGIQTSALNFKNS